MRGWEKVRQAEVDASIRRFKQEAAAKRNARLVLFWLPVSVLVILLYLLHGGAR